MIEIIEKNNQILQTGIALKITRYRSRGYTVVGVGYPFFRHEMQGLINLCNWFVDDIDDQTSDKWALQYKIKSIGELQKIGDFIIVVLSNNRQNILQQIEKLYPNSIVLKVIEEDTESVMTPYDIATSQLFKLCTSDVENLCLRESININGKCSIIHDSNSMFKITLLTLFEGAMIQNSS